MTPKQTRFVQEYLIDLNATQAAIRAGYSKGAAAEVEGSRLLRNAKVAAAIKTAMDARAERTEITQDMVLKELAKLGFSSMKRFSKWGPNGVQLLSSEDLSDEDAACVAEVSQTITENGGSVKFKLHDKANALTQIGRHLGMFTDKTEVTSEVTHVIKLDL